MTKCQLKSEKREEKAKKLKAKEKRGATLGAQINHTKTARRYRGSVKKMI